MFLGFGSGAAANGEDVRHQIQVRRRKKDMISIIFNKMLNSFS